MTCQVQIWAPLKREHPPVSSARQQLLLQGAYLSSSEGLFAIDRPVRLSPSLLTEVLVFLLLVSGKPLADVIPDAWGQLSQPLH